MFIPSPFNQMLLLVILVVGAMYFQNNVEIASSAGNKFELYYPITESPDAYLEVINESKHLYPYLAAFISLVCLIGTILGIICFAPE